MTNSNWRLVAAMAVVLFGSRVLDAAERPAEIEAALTKAGENRAQLEKALDDAPAEQQEGMQFLVRNMPDRDLKQLSADFLLENARFAYQAWDKAAWKDKLPKEVFFNNVLPYANINEHRDNWRKDFFERFMPLVKDARTPTEAAVTMNKQVFPLLEVRYSTGRPKADQSPYESIEAKTASCTGLSVLLIDACRAVGVPARFVGTPLWSNKSGNHSWVEVWDDGWHFTGACEPAGDDLDRAWFEGRAAEAVRDHPLHAIFAVSFQRTPQKFPLVWNRGIDYIHAVNVTDRYVERGKKLPEGTVAVMFRVLDRPGGQRLAATLKITDSAGQVVFEGASKDERFDANDHLTAPLAADAEFQVEVRRGEQSLKSTIRASKRDTPLTFVMEDKARGAIESLQEYLAIEHDKRPPLGDQAFPTKALSREEAARAQSMLWEDHARQIRRTRAAEMEARELTEGDLKMPFFYKTFGDKPASGRSLYFSMHGGGGAPKEVNDRQWENQKRLYQLEEGVYLVPRAPTNTWNLWHQDHIDRLFGRLIENLIVFEDVDPNRVYIMGYSAGGDGVYQLAPRMADRLAAAAMMAGHPNETSPLGLRNLPFTMHVGGKDEAYSRNKIAAEWELKLADLHKADPEGYVHLVKIYPDKGHWMDREDAAAIPWMAKHTRTPLPKRIVWKQDDVTHSRFYWLAVEPSLLRDRAEVTADLKEQQIDLQAKNVDRLIVRLNDDLLDLDKPITITSQGKPLFEGKATRTIAILAKTLRERGDPKAPFSAELPVKLRATSE